MVSEEIKRSDKIAKTLLEIEQVAGTTQNLAELYKSVHKLLNDVIDARNFYVAIYDARIHKIRFPYFIDSVDCFNIGSGTTGLGDLEKIVEYSSSPTKGSMTTMVIEKNSPMLITKQSLLDYCEKEDCIPSGSPPEIWLGAPLKSGDQVLGVVAVQSYDNPHQYTEEDIPVLRLAGEQLGLAIQRKINEKFLYETGRSQSDMASSITEITYSTDITGAITNINQISDTLFDFPQNEIAKQGNWYRFLTKDSSKKGEFRKFEDLIHPQDRIRVSMMMEEFLQEKTIFQIEYRIKTRKNKDRWVLEKGRFLDAEKGQVRLEGIILDIHDRKRAELVNQTLYNIADAVKSSLDLNDLYKIIYESLNLIINVKNFYIAIYDKTKDSVSFPFDVDENENNILYDQIIDVSQSPSLTGEIIRTGKPVLVTKSEAKALIAKYGENFIGDLSELWLGVPLKVRDEVIGAMVTQSYTDPEIYDSKDVETFISVSNQVATAIDRKRYEEELLRKELELRTLYEISNAINTTFNRNELFQCIHKSLKRIIDVKNMGIALYNEEKDVIEYPYLVDEKEGDMTFSNQYIIQNASQSTSLAYEAIRRGEPTIMGRDEINQFAKKKKEQLIGNLSQSWLGLPLKGKDKILGAIVIQNYDEPNRFKQKEIDLLVSVSGQIAFAIERKQAEADLASTQRELIEYAHKVGMANIANSTLHNIGNILNSVKTSTEQIHMINRNSSLHNFKQANNLLKEKMNTLETATSDKKLAEKLVDYYNHLEIQFEQERHNIQEQVERLIKKIDLMTDVITTQQNFTKASFMAGSYSLEEIMEDVLTMQADMLYRHKITVKKNFQRVPLIEVQRTKLIHIIINLVINAKDAMLETPDEQRILDITLKKIGARAQLSIEDSGMGISEEDLPKIFTYGFTTKKNGHGFGLHNSAIYLEDMEGQIWVESEGLDKGAVFNISFPITTKPDKKLLKADK